MRLAIQRRTILLAPATGLDRVWVARQLDTPLIQEMFGNGAHAGVGFLVASRWSPVVVGIIHRTGGPRIGFAMVIPPGEEVPHWEFAYAIPNPKDRDAFCAIHTVDAMSHYVMDHLRLDHFVGRTRVDNAPAQAILRRLGYRPLYEEEAGGNTYSFLQLDQPGWERRRALLERGERDHPSPQGAAFSVVEPRRSSTVWAHQPAPPQPAPEQPAEQNIPLAFACPGHCDFALLANRVAVKLDDAHAVQRETIALLEARMPRTLELIAPPRQVLCLDGCEVGCASATLRRCGVQPTRHYVLARMARDMGAAAEEPEVQAGALASAIQQDLPRVTVP